MVRSLLDLPPHQPQPTNAFNPTMVRLLLALVGGVHLLCRVFQSHNGAIAALRVKGLYRGLINFQSHNDAIAAHDDHSRDEDEATFQSHNGAIAAHLQNYIIEIDETFNPTMVRLLLTSAPGGTAMTASFQSHNGAIAAGSIHC